MQALGALEPLAPWIARTPVLQPADYFDGIWATNAPNGQRVGLPWYVDTRLMFVRHDLLAQAGVPRVPQSWDEWRSALARLRQHGMATPLLLPTNEFEPLLALALQQPSEVLRDGGRFGNFSSPDFRRALGFYAERFQRGEAPGLTNNQVANLWQEFGRGTFAFYISGPWNIGEFKRRLPAELSDAWSTAELPGPAGLALAATARGGRQPRQAQAEQRHRRRLRHGLVDDVVGPDVVAVETGLRIEGIGVRDAQHQRAGAVRDVEDLGAARAGAGEAVADEEHLAQARRVGRQRVVRRRGVAEVGRRSQPGDVAGLDEHADQETGQRRIDARDRADGGDVGVAREEAAVRAVVEAAAPAGLAAGQEGDGAARAAAQRDDQLQPGLPAARHPPGRRHPRRQAAGAPEGFAHRADAPRAAAGAPDDRRRAHGARRHQRRARGRRRRRGLLAGGREPHLRRPLRHAAAGGRRRAHRPPAPACGRPARAAPAGEEPGHRPAARALRGERPPGAARRARARAGRRRGSRHAAVVQGLPGAAHQRVRQLGRRQPVGPAPFRARAGQRRAGRARGRHQGRGRHPRAAGGRRAALRAGRGALFLGQPRGELAPAQARVAHAGRAPGRLQGQDHAAERAADRPRAGRAAHAGLGAAQPRHRQLPALARRVRPRHQPRADRRPGLFPRLDDQRPGPVAGQARLPALRRRPRRCGRHRGARQHPAAVLRGGQPDLPAGLGLLRPEAPGAAAHVLQGLGPGRRALARADYQAWLRSPELAEQQRRIEADPRLPEAARAVLAGLYDSDFVARIPDPLKAAGHVMDVRGAAAGLRMELGGDLPAYVPSQAAATFIEADDAEDFYRKGPGLVEAGPVTYAMAKQLVDDMLDRLASGEGAVLRFAHAEIISPLVSALGIAGEHQPQPRSQPYSYRNNPWRTETVIPMAANVQWEVWRNGAGDRLMRMLLNEGEADFKPACDAARLRPGSHFYRVAGVVECYGQPRPRAAG
ncbi:histidine acid phosphatase [Ostertagia ostertagi]